MTNLLAVFISAVLLENIVFSRALGLSRTQLLVTRPQTIVVFNLSIFFMCIISSLLGFGANYAVSELVASPPPFLREAVLFVVVLITYGLLYCILYKNLPQYLVAYQGIISFAAFNCAIYGSLLISMSNATTLSEVLVRGLGTGCGMTLATWIIYCGHKRIALCNVPRAFRGLSVTLLYIGLISLALYGLVGHSLPT